MKTLLLVAAGALSFQVQASQQFAVPSAPGISLAVTEIGQHRGKRPLLLLHGARVSSKASFDLPVPGGSLAADLAARGFDVYTLDVRGYGASTRPAAMGAAPTFGAALVRSSDAVADIDAAVDFVRQRSGNAKVALLGWATGGQWAGHYATLHWPKLSAVVMLNSLYRGASPHPLIGRGTAMEDKQRPGTYSSEACGNYRLTDAASTMGPWDRTLGEEKDSARDPALAIAGEKDFWSRQEDMQNLQADLVHSPTVRMVRIPNATHFLHLERPARGRSQLIDEVDAFVPR